MFVDAVIGSPDEYDAATKAARNAEYLDALDRSIKQLSEGRGQVHELIAVEDE